MGNNKPLFGLCGIVVAIVFFGLLACNPGEIYKAGMPLMAFFIVMLMVLCVAVFLMSVYVVLFTE